MEIMDFQDPTRAPGEVVLEIKASGMCGSDLKFYRADGGASSPGLGKLDGPIIAGHEPCGVVAAVGEGVPQEVAWEECGSCNIIIEAAGIANIAQLAGCNSASMA